ncbi:MAG: hypothetical protein E7663_07760 [Ruminococcaceae bacterium]|nr:hypothetical protein [Oscillospiraceae bacterium]
MSYDAPDTRCSVCHGSGGRHNPRCPYYLPDADDIRHICHICGETIFQSEWAVRCGNKLAHHDCLRGAPIEFLVEFADLETINF